MSTSDAVGPKLGFACAWLPDRAESWSGTPARLMSALERQGPVVDVGVRLAPPVELGLKVAFARRHEGQVVTQWRHAALTRALMKRKLTEGVRATRPDAVVMIQDLAVLPVPTMIVQDLSYEVLFEHYGIDGVPHFPGLSRDDLWRARDRQERVYAGAAALLPMSAWLGLRMIGFGVPADRVFPVHPGVNSLPPVDDPVAERPGPRRRLLIVGRDPHTKALDQVLAALEILRRDDPGITLTVAGPGTWPFPGEPPAGVDFRGRIPRDEVARLLDRHDLFVMPSRLEGFGIAFVEALSRGLPCIGRDDFAMPEIIEPGVSGALIDKDGGPEQIAEAVSKVLADDGLYERCAQAAPDVRRHYTWDRAATQIREAAARVLA